MDLAARAAELRRMGFRIVEEDADHLLAARSHFRWDVMLLRLVTGAWVQRVERLTSERIRADRARSPDLWPALDPSAWPVGIQKGRLFLGLYLAEAVDDDARALLAGPPTSGFGSVEVWAALEGPGEVLHRYPATPTFGVLLFQAVEHLLDRLRVPPRGPDEFHSAFGAAWAVFIVFGLGSLVLSLLLVLVMACGGIFAALVAMVAVLFA
jgi:hypothetical protein